MDMETEYKHNLLTLMLLHWNTCSFYARRHIVCPLVRPALCPVHIFYILEGRNPKFGVWMHLGMAECRVQLSGHCDLELDL